MRQIIQLLMCFGISLQLTACSPGFWHTDYMHGEQAQRFDVAGARILLREEADCCGEE